MLIERRKIPPFFAPLVKKLKIEFFAVSNNVNLHLDFN